MEVWPQRTRRLHTTHIPDPWAPSEHTALLQGAHRNRSQIPPHTIPAATCVQTTVPEMPRSSSPLWLLGIPGQEYPVQARVLQGWRGQAASYSIPVRPNLGRCPLLPASQPRHTAVKKQPQPGPGRGVTALHSS